MKKRSDSSAPEELRSAIMGLGARSMRKTYFPELQERLFELQRFRALLDEASDGILLVRASDRTIVDGNRTAWALVGGDEAGLRGKHVAEFCPGLDERVAPGRTVLGAGMVCGGQRHAGTPLELTVREVLFEDEMFFVVVARDVTERLRAEEELRAAKEAAEAANRAKGEFLNIAAHELKTPLTTLKILLGLLRRPRQERGTDPGVLDRLERQVRRLADLANDLVDEVRLEQGTLALRSERTDLAAAIEEAAEVCRRETPGCRVHVARPPGEVAVDADPARLAQILGELLENATRYGPEDQPVELRLLPRGDDVRVEVEDRGPGIPPEERERIFDRLHRGRPASNRTQPGLGLGLHIARRLVELHGGRIGVEAVAEGGSRFWFVLPRAPGQ